MATSEQSFADRLQRGRQLQTAIATFSPAFDPADARLSASGMVAFLNTLDGLNAAVSTAETEWRDVTAQRAALVADIQARALRASSRVKSNIAWKAQLPAVKAAADAVRGYRSPKPKAPAESAETAEAPKRRAGRSDQGYGDIKLLLDKLVAALARISAYDTGAPVDITTATLRALSTQLDALNQLVAGKEQALAAARAPRRAAYDEDTADSPCLSTRMKAVKEAVKSQYGGPSSPQYQQVRGIKV
jgi:hypothetical protein